MAPAHSFKPNWVDLDGLVNFRDCGGMPATVPGILGQMLVLPQVLYRSDNLNTLTAESADILVNQLGVTDVIDLRSDAEREVMGPSLLAVNPKVTHHELSLYREDTDQSALPIENGASPNAPSRTAEQAPRVGEGIGGQDPGEPSYSEAAAGGRNLRQGKASQEPSGSENIGKKSIGKVSTLEDMPWGGDWGTHNPADEESHIEFLSNYYLRYLRERPDSILKSLQVIADAAGATLVHCAAGKDRTGVVVALALHQVGVAREVIAEDYSLSSERLQLILGKMATQAAYADEMGHNPNLDRQQTPAAGMIRFLDNLENSYGSIQGYLESIGWTNADNAQLRHKLLGI